MQNYLLTLVIKPDLDEKERKAIIDNIKGKLDSEKGKVKTEDLWGIRDLAYKIKRQNKGFYAHFEFEAEPGNIPALDKSLKLNEDIIRYFLIRKD